MNRKAWLVGGIATVAGIAIISALLLSQRSPMFRATRDPDFSKTNQIAASREYLIFPDWTISEQFKKGDEFAVYFSRPAKENLPEGTVETYMFVDITDPVGGNTTFNITFTQTSFEVRLHQDDGGLQVDLPSEPGPATIGGTTQYAGEYAVRVYTYPSLVPYYYPNSSTMRRLQILEIVGIEYVVVRYLGTSPIYEVKLRTLDGNLLDDQPILEYNDILSFQPIPGIDHVVVTWSGGSEQVAIEESETD